MKFVDVFSSISSNNAQWQCLKRAILRASGNNCVTRIDALLSLLSDSDVLASLALSPSAIIKPKSIEMSTQDLICSALVIMTFGFDKAAS